ncbi:MAG: DedA family protein, partial [Acidobacteria bacterium]|nr:DedA family protein [Acidobacteriota bacterium]
MDGLLTYITQYGYPILALIVFLEAIGLPVPAAPALLAVGAACAKGILDPYTSLTVAIIAMLSADTILFMLGRHTGWWLLGLLCRLSVNPEACIYSSASYFHKRGRTALLFAKFLPGINTMAPPMAGSMNMHPWVFARYDLGGTLLYIFTYT